MVCSPNTPPLVVLAGRCQERQLFDLSAAAMVVKTRTDLVRGIQTSKRYKTTYNIIQCLAEIQTELNSSDMSVQANALEKLTLLQMMEITMNWDRPPLLPLKS